MNEKTDTNTDTNTSEEEASFFNVGAKIQQGAKDLGLDTPEFATRSAADGHTRTLTRRTAHTPKTADTPKAGAEDEQSEFLISVVVEERLASVIIGDMIEGVCVANRLDEKSAGEIRSQLWKSATAADFEEICSEAPMDEAKNKNKNKNENEAEVEAEADVDLADLINRGILKKGMPPKDMTHKELAKAA